MYQKSEEKIFQIFGNYKFSSFQCIHMYGGMSGAEIVTGAIENFRYAISHWVCRHKTKSDAGKIPIIFHLALYWNSQC